MNKLFTGVFLFFSTLFSCQQKGEFKSLSVNDFESLIEASDVQRLDVRTLAEYSEGRIPLLLYRSRLTALIPNWMRNWYVIMEITGVRM